MPKCMFDFFFNIKKCVINYNNILVYYKLYFKTFEINKLLFIGLLPLYFSDGALNNVGTVN